MTKRSTSQRQADTDKLRSLPDDALTALLDRPQSTGARESILLEIRRRQNGKPDPEPEVEPQPPWAS